MGKKKKNKLKQKKIFPNSLGPIHGCAQYMAKYGRCACKATLPLPMPCSPTPSPTQDAWICGTVSREHEEKSIESQDNTRVPDHVQLLNNPRTIHYSQAPCYERKTISHRFKQLLTDFCQLQSEGFLTDPAAPAPFSGFRGAPPSPSEFTPPRLL